MDFSVDDRHRERARDFARQHVAPSAARRDREARWDGALALRMGDAGLLGACVPRQHGGGGLSALDLQALQIGFGEGAEDAGLAACWGAHLAGCALPISRFGSAAHHHRYLSPLVWGGLIGALAHAEPTSVTAPTGVATRAVRRGHEWVLDGRKAWVLGGAVADLFVLTAATSPGPDGVSTFLVPRGTPGLHFEPCADLLGLRSAQLCDLSLSDCRIPADHLLGPEGLALSTVLRAARRWEQSALWNPWTGMLGALVEQTAAASRERVEHGRVAAQSQLLRAALADMKIRVELGRRLQARAAWHLDRDAPGADQDINVARLFLSTSAAQVTRDALRLQGPPGAAGLAGRLHRDAATLSLLTGGDDVTRSVIAGSLLDLG